MASTTFVDKQTVIEADWLNAINRGHYEDTVNVLDFGAIGDGDLAGNGTDDTAAIQAALDSGSLRIRIPEGIYVISSQLIVRTGISLVGDGIGITILDANIGTTGSVGLASICTLEDITLDSSFYPSSAITDTTDYSLSSRRIDLLSECLVRNVEIKNAGSGLTFGSASNNCRVYNFKFSDIRNRDGQGSGYHIAGSNDVRCYGIYGHDSDRACEIEDSATDCSVIGGKLKTIYPNGYVGQPVGYETATFVLNAHAHESTNGVKNISYRDIVVESSALPIDCQRSSGTLSADMPQNITWDNIRIVSPIVNAQVPNAIYIEGVNCKASNIIFEGTAIDAAYGALIKVFGVDSRGNNIEDVEIGQKYNGMALDISAGHTTIRGVMVEDQSGTATVEECFSVTGSYVTVENCRFITPESLASFIKVSNGADYAIIKHNYFIHPAVNDVTAGAIALEGQYGTVTGNVFESTLASQAVIMDGVAAFNGGLLNKIDGNTINYGAAANVIELKTNCNRNIVTNNITSSNSQVILNSGTDNTVIDNKRGNVFS